MSDGSNLPAEHSILSASGSERWLNCPASISRSKDLPSVSGKAAAQGTLAHEVAEELISKGSTVDYQAALIGFEPEERRSLRIWVEWVNRVKGLLGDDVEMHTELRVSLKPLSGVPAMFGTADVVIYSAKHKCFVIADYKHGKWVPVFVQNNWQLRYYTVGVARWLQGLGKDFDRFMIAICQPRPARLRRTPVQIVSYKEGCSKIIDTWESTLLRGAVATQGVDPQAKAGSWCRFCQVRNFCPEHKAVYG